MPVINFRIELEGLIKKYRIGKQQHVDPDVLAEFAESCLMSVVELLKEKEWRESDINTSS
jgi:hypothetical protein